MKVIIFLLSLSITFILGCTVKPVTSEYVEWGENIKKPSELKVNPEVTKYTVGIQEGLSVDGVKCGDSRLRVFELWGEPTLVTEDQFMDELGEKVVIFQYANRGITLYISKAKDQVCHSFILNRAYRGKTSRGIEYGDTIAKVVQLYGTQYRQAPGNWYYYDNLGIGFKVEGPLGNQIVIEMEVKCKN